MMMIGNMMINIIIIIMAGDGNRVEGRHESYFTRMKTFFLRETTHTIVWHAKR